MRGQKRLRPTRAGDTVSFSLGLSSLEYKKTRLASICLRISETPKLTWFLNPNPNSLLGFLLVPNLCVPNHRKTSHPDQPHPPSLTLPPISKSR
ncbi:hypothetical protein L3X38_000724 [Prunus dulcis]|uniref:Uncharacterized protein n=1 Tax=Prunus dulcis TaxID=3755 RepID=A0AAD4WT74_PRUDU|nr:hypothetical protein L3X38_000724 [Prunus dulcis]